jgi:hypothetical protein
VWNVIIVGQREGVKFLYECLTELRDFEGSGAILADEMGLFAWSCEVFGVVRKNDVI